jgi:hypothetical protein
MVGMIQDDEMGRPVTRVEESNVYKGFVGNPERRRSLGRPRHMWKDSIEMDFREIRCGDMDWINLVQDGEWDGGYVEQWQLV